MSELTDRYVGATLRSIPVKQRGDIEAELRGSIQDAIDARVAAGGASSTAEEEVLSELGDPDRLASGYIGAPGYLIGPDHFFVYRRLLAVLLLTVTPIVMAVAGVGRAIAGDEVGEVFARVLGTGISLVVQITFWTTLVFYFIERNDSETGTEWSVDKLPPEPSEGSITLGDTIASIVFLVITISMIVIARDVSPITAADGSPIPLFAPTMWDFWFPFLIVVLGAEIVFEVIKHRVGGWTWALASMNAAINALFAIPVVYLLATDQMLNDDFVDELPREILSADWLLIAIVVVIAVWDVVNGFRKAYLAR